jgi:hypothetical protein
MRIVIFDSWNGKFSKDFVEHWKSLGHEVRFNPTWEDAKGADINFFYQSDNGLVDGVNKGLTGKIYAQCVDIEVWAGQASAVDWSKVSGCIFMADHIKEKVEREAPKIMDIPRKIIKPGIDVTKWSVRPPVDFSKPIRKIVYIVGDRRIWDVKRLDIAFQILRDLLDSKPKLIWQLHIRGTYSTHQQYNAYCQHLQKDLKLDDFVVWYEERIEDLNKWLDDKDYFFLASTKEVFSYATAETMAKGIKPIIGNWQSAKDTWGPFVCETYGQMLAEILRGKYEPERYRKYVEDNYSSDRYFKEIDSFVLGGESV